MPNPLRGLIARATRAALADPGGPADGQLLGRFVEAGDPEAFAALVRRHGPMVYGVCRRILGRDDPADDAFQAVFVVLARRADRVRPREAVGNWLYGVAARTARAARAKAARRARREVPLAAATAAPPDPDLPDWAELLPHLDREVERLPDRYRLPVVLCELEGRPRREVARRLGVPEGTLSSRLAYARKLLAARLRRYRPALSAAGLAAALHGAAAAATPVPPGLSAQASNATGAVPAAVRALSNDVGKVMLLTKLKLVGVALLAAGALPLVAPRPDPVAAAPVPKQAPAAPKRWVPGGSWVAHKIVVNVVLFSPDGKQVFSGVSLVAAGNPALPDKPFQEFTRWDAATGERQAEFRDDEAGAVLCAATAPDRKRGAYGTRDKRLVVWDEVGGKPVVTVEAGSPVQAVAVAPGGGWVVTGGDGGVAGVWDVATGKGRVALRGHTGAVSGVAVSPDGKTVATGGEDETVRFWDPATGKELRRVEKAGWAAALAYTPDGTRLLCGTAEALDVRDAATGRRLHALPGMTMPGCGVPLSPDGTLAAVYTSRPETNAAGVTLWDVTTGREAAFLPTKLRGFRQVAFSPDGKRLVVSGTDGAERGVLETWAAE
jgi:RNA polymerase sigma factor (sigma-70 family)